MVALSTADPHRIVSAFRSATTPDFQSRSAYIGQIIQTEHVTIIADDGTTFEKEVSFPISWDSISKILGIIRKRAEG